MKAKRQLEEIQSSQRRKLVEHQEQAVMAMSGLEFFGQATADLVEDEPDQRFGAADVGGRHDQVEG